MKFFQSVTLETLSAAITGRADSFLNKDIDVRSTELKNKIQGARILVIGGAGSIGASTIRAIVPFKPGALHVVDQSENQLAELVRDLRSGKGDFRVSDFRALPLDLGSPVMERFLNDAGRYDYVLNFAALKHVRSEKDIYSLLQMFDTNIVRAGRLLTWLNNKNLTSHFFAVSTDKAANPVSLMGASKRIMEELIFSDAFLPLNKIHVTSARFANVAFSDGSLLAGFLNRLKNRQPFAVPVDTKRYFVSLEEAGQICLLSAFCGEDRFLLIPKLNPEEDLIELKDVAVKVLEAHGFTPRFYTDEKEAKDAYARDTELGFYPVLVTSLDTSGEKPYEEFVGRGENVKDLGFDSLLGVAYSPDVIRDFKEFMNQIEVTINSPEQSLKKDAIADLISSTVPQLNHKETDTNLDGRM